jgi:hypothetical protein
MDAIGNRKGKLWLLAAIGAMAASMVQAQEDVQPKVSPVGEAKSAKIKTLELGAKALQNNSSIKGFDIYLVGFHAMKDHPELKMGAHHYCHQVNQDFAQCILFDSNTRECEHERH